MLLYFTECHVRISDSAILGSLDMPVGATRGADDAELTPQSFFIA